MTQRGVLCFLAGAKTRIEAEIKASGLHSLRMLCDTADGTQEVSDIRHKFRERLRLLLEGLAHLDQTGKCSQYQTWILKATGGFGDVYEGCLNMNGEEIKVALKLMRSSLCANGEFAKFLAREILVWSKLSHRNVIAFMGFLFNEAGFPVLISRWMDRGTALEYIKLNPNADVFSLVSGVAQGLEYLHQEDVVHSDIKSDNILISESGIPQIGDFGMSRMVVASQSSLWRTSSGSLKGSIPWLAIEFLKPGKLQYRHTKETDVWAFGMTIYELLSQRRPYDDIRDILGVINAIATGKKPPIPKAKGRSTPDPVGSQPLWKLCKFCWNNKPQNRWTISGAVKYLSKTSVRQRWAQDYQSQSYAHEDAGEWEESIRLMQAATEILKKLSKEDPTIIENLAGSYHLLGSYYSKLQKWDEALDATRAAVEAREEILKDKDHVNYLNMTVSMNILIDAYPDAASEDTVRFRLAESYHALGTFCNELQKRDEAVKATQAAVELMEKLFKDDRKIADKLANSYHKLGYYYGEIANWHEAVKATRAAVGLRERLLKGDSTIASSLASSNQKLGYYYSELAQWGEAVKATQAAVQLKEKLLKKDPTIAPSLAESYQDLGSYHFASANWEEAINATQASVKLRENGSVDDPTVAFNLAVSYRKLGKYYERLGKMDEAEEAKNTTAQLERRLVNDRTTAASIA